MRFHSQNQEARERDNQAEMDRVQLHEEKQQKWDRRFLKLAQEVATWSKDPSTKVGSVIVNHRRIVSLGFNGFPHGVEDTEERLNNRDEKLARTMHAELNAILNARGSVTGMTLYCTFFPCSNCGLAIIAAGIHRVVAPLEGMDNPRWKESFERTRDLFQEAGVKASVYP